MTNRLLLTGAGFSSNFGAPLASDMYTIIFRDKLIQNSEKFRSLFNTEKNFDYESIYQMVLDSEDYTDTEKDIFSEVIKNAYLKVDRMITNNDHTHSLSGLYNKLLFRFAKYWDGSGFIFTLNQDVLFERRFNHYPNSRLSLPEIPIIGSRIFQKSWNPGLNSNDYSMLPNEIEFESRKNDYFKRKNQIQLSYIKLHGSQDWIKRDNNQILIVGADKDSRIKAEPLLDFNFQIFEEQLNTKNPMLLAIGYGFNDIHINRALAETKNLKIHIINPELQSSFSTSLKSKPYGYEIYNALEAYYKVNPGLKLTCRSAKVLRE